MHATKLNKRPASQDLGELLRHWRDLRSKTQFDLSLDTGVSQRHISFIENGRSVPGRDTLIALADALDIPLRERNALFLAAGYAPVYSEGDWNAVEMQAVNQALQRMLRQHEPYPAVVMDRYWNVRLANDAAPRFFNHFIDMAARKPPRNLLHLMFDPHGMRPFIANWPAAAKSLIQRVHRESVGRTVDEQTQTLVASLLAYPGVKTDWQRPEAPSTLPFIPLSFTKNGRVLNYFSLVTTVGTPQTVAAQELRLECMFPADETTETQHAEIMGTAHADGKRTAH